MSNDKHYPLHPNATHPPIMTCEIPLDEYESLKRENERLNRELEHVKNGDCIYTCDVVEKHVKEELKAKRALYKACVNWMTNRQCAMRCYDLEARAKKFDKAIAKCRAKAEEYK